MQIISYLTQQHVSFSYNGVTRSDWTFQLRDVPTKKYRNSSNNRPSLHSSNHTHTASEAMSSNSFNPDTDIPTLAGKVVFITGGECRKVTKH